MTMLHEQMICCQTFTGGDLPELLNEVAVWVQEDNITVWDISVNSDNDTVWVYHVK